MYWLNNGQSPLKSLCQPRPLSSLPSRPSYIWKLDPALCDKALTLAPHLFSHTLADEERKANVDLSRPSKAPSTPRRLLYKRPHENATEVNNVKTPPSGSLQYPVSSIFRPLDVLAHPLAQVFPVNEKIAYLRYSMTFLQWSYMRVAQLIARAMNWQCVRSIFPSTFPPQEIKFHIGSHSSSNMFVINDRTIGDLS